jgi:hypothetical protein
VRRHEHGSVLDLVCQGQELLAQCLRRLELGTLAMIVHKPTQHRETLVRLFQMFTELPSVGVCLAHFSSSVAFHGKQRGSQSDQHVYFALDALTGLRQRLEQLQPFGDVTDGFHMR